MDNLNRTIRAMTEVAAEGVADDMDTLRRDIEASVARCVARVRTSYARERDALDKIEGHDSYRQQEELRYRMGALDVLSEQLCYECGIRRNAHEEAASA